MQKHLLSLVLVFATLSAVGCATRPVVTAPPAPPADRHAHVYLAHYDFFHTSLVVPRVGGGVTEYTYADWDVLARDRRTTWTKVAAVALPTRGTLGRGEVQWDGSSDQTLRKALDRCWKLSRYRVDARQVERLTQKLDADFAAASARTGTTQRGGMVFVKARRPYSVLHNCNHALREWLLDLGFRVPRGVALADFQTPDAAHSFAPGRESVGMRTDFNELVGERPDGP